jgi:hypothetical protein
MTPPSRPVRLSLKLGAVLVLLWLAATMLVVLLRAPPIAAKTALGACAAVWAVHVGRVLFLNRRR